MTRFVVAIFFFLILGFGIFFYLSKNKGLQDNSDLANSPLPNEPTVIINSVRIPVLLAKTNEEIQKGLSGSPALDNKKGMLFIFAQPFVYKFWMKDMSFPLDIIWINNGKVVDISKNTSNIFDPANPRFYKPSKPAQFVLEVNANFASNHQIKVGDAVTFNAL